MEMWVQLRDCDDDVHFSDDVTYEVQASGVLEIASRTEYSSVQTRHHPTEAPEAEYF